MLLRTTLLRIIEKVRTRLTSLIAQRKLGHVLVDINLSLLNSPIIFMACLAPGRESRRYNLWLQRSLFVPIATMYRTSCLRLQLRVGGHTVLHRLFRLGERHLLEVVTSFMLWAGVSLIWPWALAAARAILLLLYLEPGHQWHPGVGSTHRIDVLSRLVAGLALAEATGQSLDVETILVIDS